MSKKRKLTVRQTYYITVTETVEIEPEPGETDEELAERAVGLGNPPSLCAQCTGWNRPYSQEPCDVAVSGAVRDEQGQELYSWEDD